MIKKNRGENILAKGLSVAIQVFAGVQSAWVVCFSIFFKEENVSRARLKAQYIHFSYTEW